MSSSWSATMQRRAPKRCDAVAAPAAVVATTASSSSLPSDSPPTTVAAGDGPEGKPLMTSIIETVCKRKGGVFANKLYEKGVTPCCSRSLMTYCHYCSLLFFCIVFGSSVFGFSLRGAFEQFHISSKQIAAESPSSVSVSSWSNPLSTEMKDGCWQWEGPSFNGRQAIHNSSNNQNINSKDNKTKYSTPQQWLQAPRGLVISLLLGKGVTDSICNFFPGQVKHFFLQQRGIDMLFLLPSSDSDHLPPAQPTMDEVLNCLNLKRQQPVAIKTWRNLDGTNLTTYEYTYDFMLHQATTTATNNRTKATFSSKDQQQPPPTGAQEKKKTFSVFLAYTPIRLPRYVKVLKYDLENLKMKNGCQTSHEYIQGTRWYVNECLHLGILKEGNYEYFLKVDTDISFRKPFPIHLLHDMKVRGAVFAHTARYFTNSTSEPCGDRSLDMLQEFRQHYIQRKVFGRNHSLRRNISTLFDSFDEMGLSKNVLNKDWIHKSSWNGNICSARNSRMHWPHDLYYTNFIIGRTDYFQRPEVMALGQYMSEWPHGFFEYRWTDQIFYHFALGYFIGPDYEQAGAAVADYSEFRCAPKRNCWYSIFDDSARFMYQCDNEGVFRHGKSATFKTDWSTVDNWNAYENQDKSFEYIRQSIPYETKYQSNCSGH